MAGQIAHQIEKQARILTIKIVGKVTDTRALRDIPRIWQLDPGAKHARMHEHGEHGHAMMKHMPRHDMPMNKS